MGLPKGKTNNPNGRKVGSRNRKTVQWEVLSDSITDSHSEKFNKFMDKLWDG